MMVVRHHKVTFTPVLTSFVQQCLYMMMMCERRQVLTKHKAAVAHQEKTIKALMAEVAAKRKELDAVPAKIEQQLAAEAEVGLTNVQ